MARLLRAALLAVLISGALGLPLAGPSAPLAAPVLAADDQLEISTAARYVVDPRARRVRVTIDITAVNRKADVVAGGSVTRYFYDAVNLGVQPEAANLRATEDGQPLTVQAAKRDGYRLLTVRFRDRVYADEAATIRLTYALPTGAPRSDSDVRVGPAFTTFVAWAFGDHGTVRVEVPARYDVETSGDALTRASGTQPGPTTFTAVATKPIDWFAWVTGTDDDALTRDRLAVGGGDVVLVRAWPDDGRWRSRVKRLLRSGIPELVDRIGLPWPVDRALTVTEVHTPLLEGYAGFYDQGAEAITISEDLDDLTIVHEASHAWFNKGLFIERWITEGLADEYAARVVRAVGGPLQGPEIVDRNGAAAFPLEAWGPPTPIRDAETSAREQYGYGASWRVMRLFVQKVGEARMRKLFAAVADRTTAYRGEGPPEGTALPNDWRRLLDLADELDAPAGLENLFERWVLDEPEQRLLRERMAARRTYEALVDRGDTWAAPVAVRMAMEGWRFGPATDAMDAATTVLDRRDDVATLAATEDLVPAAASEARYQAADTEAELAVLGEELGASLAVLRDLDEASQVAAAPRDWLVNLGLDGADPDAGLQAARAAWESGDLDAARSERAGAVAALERAPGAGRTRAITIGGAIGAMVLLLLLVLAVVAARVRGRGRRAAAGTLEPAVVSAAAPSPYATLADHAAPVEPTAGPASGDEGAPRT